MAENKKYITLKEAAKISGYAPDYVGQLIRAGKLNGKQIYRNVAWVTTEEDLKEYMDEKKNSSMESLQKPAKEQNNVIMESKRLQKRLVVMTRAASYVMIVISAIMIFAIFYIVSISIEKRMQEKALEKEQEIKLPPIKIENRKGL